MEVISVQKVVSDYCDLNIHGKFLGERGTNKIKSGLLQILANNGVILDLSDPTVYRKDFDKLYARYKTIVDKVELNLKKKKDKFSNFDDKKLASSFFSQDEFSSLLKPETKSR